MTEPIVGYIIYFDIAAFVICLISLAVVFLKRDYKKPENKWLIAIFVNSMLCVVFDIWSAYAIDYPSQYSYDLAYATTYIYYFFHSTHPFLYFMFSYHFLEAERKRLKKNLLLMIIPYAAIVGFMIAQFPTNIVFKIDKVTHGYSTGIGYYIIMALSVFYIGMCVFMLNHKRAINNKKIIVTTFAVFGFLSLFIHYFFAALLLELFIQSVVFLVVFLLLSDSANAYDDKRKVYNYLGFRNDVNVLFKRKNPTACMIVVKNPDLKGITSRYGKKVTEQLVNKMIVEVRHVYPDSLIYDLENGKFVIAHREGKKVSESEMRDKIEEIFSQNWKVEKYTFGIHSNVVLVRVPDDFDQEEELTQFVEKFDGFETIIDVKRQIAVEKAVFSGIVNNSFYMVYQPLFNVETGKYDRVEALVRLVDEELGYISPDEFVGDAEQGGLMLDLGEIVINQVLGFLRDNNLKSYGVEKVNINLSPTQCSTVGFSKHLTDLVKEYGIDPSLLCFEVTETMAFHDINSLKRLIDDLHKAGSSIALDDFGTGYSNLVNVFSLGYDEIKVDKSILWSTTEENQGMIILDQIVGMIKQSNKEVVVEGVETEEQLEHLKKIGCNLCQGFLFSKPLKGEEYLTFVECNR